MTAATMRGRRVMANMPGLQRILQHWGYSAVPPRHSRESGGNPPGVIGLIPKTPKKQVFTAPGYGENRIWGTRITEGLLYTYNG